MKTGFLKILLPLALILAMSTGSIAGVDYGASVPFSNYSAASGAAVYSSAYRVAGYSLKTVSITGTDMTTLAAAALSGTVLVQCGPTSSGPWSTCLNNNYAQTAVSTTANGTLTWRDAAAYIRVSWAKTAGRVKVWLNWSE